ncbi:Nicotinate degradation protein R [Limihaloglobus sulfuriphilus]|uniref:Nicotinate degradation protein R n=1 Tax=Limihaloglobus sulfuriphilus TaxID=1851148 RepID=A0A1Q2MG68_9BACT|nr:MarR family transcriptional regulator [Limihaloglobus sulfuriphilus]AQQ71548.1 Nicotinate degradation protein R [Limihaloglobus sulfuriphilus]
MRKFLFKNILNNSEEASCEFFEECQVRILMSLRRIIHAVDIHSRKLNQNYQITAPQLICIHTLASEGKMTQSALSKSVNLSVSTINGIIDRLEKKGLVARIRDTVDRRKVFVKLTQEGQSLADSAPSLMQESFSDALRKLPELEQAAIAMSLERVVDLMEAKQFKSSEAGETETQLYQKKG